MPGQPTNTGFHFYLWTRWSLALLLLAVSVTAPAAWPWTREGVKVDRLRCEYLENPLGLDVAAPRLAWQLESAGRGVRQTAYQVQVATSERALGAGQADLWDTGLVNSGDSIKVVYNGKPLAARQRAWWRVRVWTVNAQGIKEQVTAASAWSRPAWFEMGLLAPGDWVARWIGGPPPAARRTAGLGESARWIWLPGAPTDKQAVCFRAPLELPAGAQIESATAQMTADNAATLYINGQKAGHTGIWSTLGEFNVQAMLRPGRNIIAVRASNDGAMAGMILGLTVKLRDGRTFELRSDDQWRTAESDAKDWRQPEFDDSAWGRAIVVGAYGDAPWGRPLPAGQQLAPAPLLRREFRVEGRVRQARAYVCGLGCYELYLNGKRVGDRVLEPAITDYQKRALYSTYDVTGCLKRGANAAGLMLGDGWFNQCLVWGGMSWGEPRAIMQLEITYADGRTERLVTDGAWQTTSEGPVRSNNIYAGEQYDARREIAGWAAPGFNPGAGRPWSPARLMDAPADEDRPAQLQSQLMPPIRRTEELKPVALTQPAPGVWIYDLGQNFAGWVRLRAKAPAGTAVQMRFAEALLPGGLLDPESTGVAATGVVQTDGYTFKGHGMETWEPRFTYHGFRYVELTGLPDGVRPTLGMLTGVAVHTAPAVAGSFECSDPLLNRIHQTALWTERSNLHGVATDCPHRERCGWLGDAHVSAETTIFNFDMPLFWTKYLRDIETSLLPDGFPTYIAPGKRTCGKASVDWATAHVQLPWYLYLYYGDRRPLEEHYASCARWLGIVEGQLDGDGILRQTSWGGGLGDWCPPDGDPGHLTPVPLTSTAYVFFDYTLMARFADLLGRPEEAQAWRQKAGRVREGFNKIFFKPELNDYGSQTADALALYLGLAPEGCEQALADRLARDVTDLNDSHLTTGIMGWRFLLGQLGRYGHGDVALGILKKEDYPSVGWLFKLGATTLWECWGGGVKPGDKLPGFSYNHPMQGGFDTWFYDGLAGIQPDPERPGFRHVILRPTVVPGLAWARAEYQSPLGPIRSAWRQTPAGPGGRVELDITIPPNATATLYLPATAAARVTESGRDARQAAGLTYKGQEPAHAVFEAGSGVYHFVVEGGDTNR